jgi:hypothetical protein
MESTIFQPIVALAAWTMIMWAWMYATRLPAMGKVPGLDAKNMVGGIGADLDKVLPGKVQWIAHNYNHLHEQPTVFYAVAFALALMGQGDGFNTTLAWIYVGLRVAHSLVQVLLNRVIIRFAIFALSGVALAAMTLHAVIAAFH